MIHWTDKQLDLLKKLDLPFDPAAEMSDDQLEEMYEEIPEHFEWHPKTGMPVGDCMDYEDMLTLVYKEMEPRGLFV